MEYICEKETCSFSEIVKQLRSAINKSSKMIDRVVNRRDIAKKKYGIKSKTYKKLTQNYEDLLKSRWKILDLLEDVRKLELDFMKSSMHPSNAEKSLISAASAARKTVQAITSVAKAIKSAAELTSIVARLANLIV